MKVGRAPKKNGALIFTFASRQGETRSVDLSQSITAWFGSKILDRNNGKFNFTDALSNMPDYVGFTTVSKALPKIASGLNIWNDEKKQMLQAKLNGQRDAILAGFNPQPFLISTPTTNNATDNIFEEEKKGTARRAAPARQAAAAAQ